MHASPFTTADIWSLYFHNDKQWQTNRIVLSVMSLLNFVPAEVNCCLLTIVFLQDVLTYAENIHL